jgi:hypothetical protein
MLAALMIEAATRILRAALSNSSWPAPAAGDLVSAYMIYFLHVQLGLETAAFVEKDENANMK